MGGPLFRGHGGPQRSASQRDKVRGCGLMFRPARGTGAAATLVRRNGRGREDGHSCFGSPALPVLGWGSSGQEDAAAQQIEPGPAVHGALEGLDAVHLSFDRARGPGQLQRVLDGGRIAFQALGEAR
jgi:hypothetical protein